MPPAPTRVWLTAFIAGAVVVGGHEDQAEACSCVPPTLVSPSPGSTDVPTNAELFRSGNGPRVVTLVGGGESVEIELSQLTCGGYRYQAQLHLQPATAYEVLQYDPPQVLTSFTTGKSSDEEAPVAATIDDLWFGVDDAEDHSDCGGRTQIDLSVVAPRAATLLVHRETSLGGCDMIIFPEETGNFGSPYGEDCRVFTALDPGEEYCWEVRARDLAGNEGPATQRCAAVLQCASANGSDLTDCTLPSSVAGCAIDSRENPLSSAVLVGAAIFCLVVRRRRSER